jgi:DNA topoisomerase-1
METITLEQALLLFKMPRVVGEFEGKEMKVGIGRFGPYVVHDILPLLHLGKTDDPYTVGPDRCIELIKAKREKDLAKIIKLFPENPDLKVLQGRWGPCITLVKEFYRIPKDKDPAKLTFGDVVNIIGGPDAYEQAVINAHAKKNKFGAKKGKGKAEPKAKAAKGKAAKVVAIKKPAKKVAAKAVVKTTVFKKAASKKTTPKRVIKATRKKAAKRK